MRAKVVLTALLLLVPSTAGLSSVRYSRLLAASIQRSHRELETKLESQYRETQKLFASPPSPIGRLPVDYQRLLREWQDDLAQSFVRAAATVEQILALNPSNREIWQERLETLQLYSGPVSSPTQRTVFGSGEVQTSARVIETPLAEYTN